MLIRIFLLILSLLIIPGCGTLLSQRVQEHEIVSMPPGAEIYSDGEFKGITPHKIEIGRSYQPEIELRVGNNSQKVLIESKYRWDMAVYNIPVLFYGHAIDFIVGTAWENTSPGVIALDESLKSSLPLKKRIVLVLPPLNYNEAISDNIGEWMVTKLIALHPDYDFIPFDKSVPLYEQFGVDNYATLESRERSEFLKELKKRDITHIVDSAIFEVNGILHISGQIIDLETSKIQQTVRFERNKSILPSIAEKKFFKKLQDRFFFIPNTMSIDFANESHEWQDLLGTQLSEGPQSIKTTTLAGLIGSLGFSYFKPPTRKRFLIPELTFIPGTWGNYGRWRLSETSEYELTRVGIGYGPMFGLRSRWGFPYVKILFGPEWTQFKSGKSVGRKLSPLVSVTEFGYIKYLSSRITFRFFVRSGTVPVAHRDALQNNKLFSLHSTYSGISLGFYFPDRLHPIRKIISPPVKMAPQAKSVSGNAPSAPFEFVDKSSSKNF